jgi:thymidine phosphorylase
MDEKTFKTRTKKLAVAIIHQTEKLASNDYRIYQDSSQSQILNPKPQI